MFSSGLIDRKIDLGEYSATLRFWSLHRALEVMDNSTLPTTLGGFGFPVPFSGLIQNFQVSAESDLSYGCANRVLPEALEDQSFSLSLSRLI